MSSQQPSGILTKPSMTALSLILRSPELWPEGFKWDYSECSTCAMGLAARLWASSDRFIDRKDYQYFMLVKMGFDDIAAEKMFFGAHRQLGMESLNDVSPDDVADMIDAWIARQPAHA